MSSQLIKGVLDTDPWLEPFSQELVNRQVRFKEWNQKLVESESSLSNFASAYKQYGLHANWDTKEVTITEYIPDVAEVALVGDFNHWDFLAHQLTKVNEFSLWKLSIPPVNGEFAVPHDSRYKIAMKLGSGEIIYRLCPGPIGVLRRPRIRCMKPGSGTLL